jgi:DNA-binding MarR family transcriptional regulator
MKISDLETHLGYWLRLVSNCVSQSFARRLDAEGITVAEWVFLRKLYDDEDVPPSRLAETMGMTKGAISKLAERLIAKGLVVRTANEEDRRGQTIALTDGGRTRVPLLAALADDNDTEFFGHLDAAERKTLESLMRKIADRRGLTGIASD